MLPKGVHIKGVTAEPEAIRRPYGLVIRVGLLTAAVILCFQTVNLLVMYRYLKLDLYLCLVAVFFLVVGLLMNRRHSEVRTGKKEVLATEELAGEMPREEIMAKEQVADETRLVKTAGLEEIMEMLSAKEWQILKLVAEGMTNKEIAAAQFVEVSTVKTHLNNIYGKLSVGNRKEARVKYAELAAKWPVMG